MKRKALGKGLHAFIPEELSILKDDRYADLDVEQLKPNPLQPRQKFNQESLKELAQSIKTSGVLQPILVAPEGDYYRIIVGERRWRAAQKIGLKKIPVLIRNIPPGLGSYVHWDRKLDAKLAAAIMSINAIKGVQVGTGFKSAHKKGSEFHDEIYYEKNELNNHAFSGNYNTSQCLHQISEQWMDRFI